MDFVAEIAVLIRVLSLIKVERLLEEWKPISGMRQRHETISAWPSIKPLLLQSSLWYIQEPFHTPSLLIFPRSTLFSSVAMAKRFCTIDPNTWTGDSSPQIGGRWRWAVPRTRGEECPGREFYSQYLNGNFGWLWGMAKEKTRRVPRKWRMSKSVCGCNLQIDGNN